MRDFARAVLIALGFLVLASPAAYKSSARAFGVATLLSVAVNVILLLLGSRDPVLSGPHATRNPGGTSRTDTVAAAAVAAVGAVLLFIACRSWLHQILIYPNDSLRADMLVVIQQGIRRILQARNPYTIYQVPWNVTLPYGPVLWAPYILPHLLRADVRFVSMLGALFVPAACTLAAAGLASARRFAAAAGLLLVAAAVASSPDMRGFASIAHTPSYWPLLALFAWLVARERWHAAAIAAGLLIVGRTTMIAIAPVLLVAVWHRDRRRLPGTVLLLAAAAVLPFLPFAIWDRRALAFALYGSYQALMKGFVWTQTTWAHDTIGITGLLLRAGLQRFMEAAQAVVMLAAYAFAWRSIAAGRRPLPWMAFALMAFSMTTFWPVHYIYLDVLLLWIFATIAEAPWPQGRRVWPAWSVSLAAAALVLAAVSWIDIPRDPAIDAGTGAARPLLYRGFSNDEGDDPTFAWIDGRQAEILVARRSRTDADITIVCQPHLPARGATQQMSVVLNGVVLGTVMLREGWNPVTFGAPARAWQIGVNELILSASSAVSPRDAGTGDDNRQLSVAVDRLFVRSRVLP